MKTRHAVLMLVLTPLLMGQGQPPPGGMPPPPEAFKACRGKAQGTACRFRAPHGVVSGACRVMGAGGPVCVPSFGPGVTPPGRMGDNPALGGRPPPRAKIAPAFKGARPVRSNLPDTGQGSCFNEFGMIDCPRQGLTFHGQDAQYQGRTPSYQDLGDGTVLDQVTSLMWQKAHNTKRLSWNAAQNACRELRLGGRDDWRLPTIKELFSIADFSGAVGISPYLNPVFEIRPPGRDILAGDPFSATHRVEMMGQTWSATLYAGDHWDRKGVEAAFFFNFLDGRIKQAPTRGRATLFHRCVRGAEWGVNDFVADRDGTVKDRASGLVWQQDDDGQPRLWREALRYCETLKLAGHDDWRLPNVKELQSLVDYRRPAPAIDTGWFGITDPEGWFWSSTTLGDDIRQATYICFGKCVSVDGVDVHGAGAERGDPKTGAAADYPHGLGGQRDQVRILNYARCVR